MQKLQEAKMPIFQSPRQVSNGVYHLDKLFMDKIETKPKQCPDQRDYKTLLHNQIGAT